MTITRRELLKDGVIAAASSLPVVNLISESELCSSKTETPKPQKATRIWFNNHKYNFRLTNIQVTLRFSQCVKTNAKGVHFKIGDRYFSMMTSYRDPQRGEWYRMCGATYSFNLDAEGWQLHRQRAMELLGASTLELGRRYPYPTGDETPEQAAIVVRATAFTGTCERIARIIERMTPPDQIIVETYPELALDQAGHGSH